MESAPRKVEIFTKTTVGFLLHILHLLSVIAIIWACLTFIKSRHDSDIVVKILVCVASVFNLIYCLTFLSAPRFAIKGRLFWKTSPFLFSGLLVHVAPFLIEFRRMNASLYWTLFPVSLALFIGLYAGVYVRVDHALGPFLRPYIYTRVDNPLSSGDLLEHAPYGAPITINNSFKGQPPVTMRFGSHAIVPGKF